ncbi:abortive infection system antitoxin AbiGi family protein [Paenibacillus sp. UASWS1643]|uniref:abortive infection system antitoxin AbiGi family protein n=1 Tax=Paenibacillus sp. UASWS1643 TaxID=2580422 RepID=UPI00123BF615|nr:abortive infection system antitoxin AbiGi family protein [Paenibacillus sp. UASWS1643]KAA8748203.1 hypothetical protein FE296_19115 [Paenibacillus sp. UASWS1643]
MVNLYLEETPLKSPDPYIRPNQSANVLFNFMDDLEYLKKVIEFEALLPRYNEEKVDFLNIPGLDKIALPMKCFCDIHLNKLKYHTDFYGFYGIGINKEWGISKGIQPIQYINLNSPLIKDYSHIIGHAIRTVSEESNPIIEMYNNYLLAALLYMKPISGKMFRKGDYKDKNFHDEREWRFIPNVTKDVTDLPLILPQEQLNPKAYEYYSNGIKHNDNLWIKLDLNIVRYIIVKNRIDREDLIDFILELDKEQRIKLDLISKIMIFDELGEDW